MYSYKDLEELSGYTARVSLLLDTMTDIRNGKFDKPLINGATKGDISERERFQVAIWLSTECLICFLVLVVLKDRGQILESEDICFEKVPIITPNGDILVRSLSFHVRPGVKPTIFARIVDHI